MNKLAEIGAALIGGAFHHVEAIYGGDLSAILRIELSDGRRRLSRTDPRRKPRRRCFVLSPPAERPRPPYWR
jgi:hypothetical protein